MKKETFKDYMTTQVRYVKFVSLLRHLPAEKIIHLHAERFRDLYFIKHNFIK